MIRKLAQYGAGLIALYLVVYNAEGARRLISEGAEGAVGIGKMFQGR